MYLCNYNILISFEEVNDRNEEVVHNLMKNTVILNCAEAHLNVQL
jgi:hypothetical protein